MESARFSNQNLINAATSLSDTSDMGHVVDSGKAQAPPHLWLPFQLRNARMAVSVCAENEAWLKARPPTDLRRKVQYTSWPKSYYFIRQFALSFYYPVLWPALFSALETCTLDTLQTHEQLCGFMVVHMSEEEQMRHGIPKPEEEITLDDEINNNDSQPDWERALDIMWKMWLRRGCADALRQYVWGESMLTGPLEEDDL